MPNTKILTDQGQEFYPITHVSCVVGMENGGRMNATYAWDGTGTPVVANIPAGVTVTYDGNTYTGTLAASASTTGMYYLVPSTTVSGEYDRYITEVSGNSFAWKASGTTAIPSPDLVANLNSTDDSKALAASQGKVLGDGLSQLEAEVTPMSQLYKGQTTLNGTFGSGAVYSGGYYVPSSTSYNLYSFPVKSGKTYHIKVKILTTTGSSLAAVAFYAGATLPTGNTNVTEVLKTLGTIETYEANYTPAADGFLLIMDSSISNVQYTTIEGVTTLGYIDFQSEINAINTAIQPVPGLISDVSTLLKVRSPYGVTFFVGNGTTYVGNNESERVKTRVLPNRKYRIFVANTVDYTGISSGAIFTIRCEKADGTYTEEVVVNYPNPINSYYDITTPSGCVYIYIGGRCVIGDALFCLVTDALSLNDVEDSNQYSVTKNGLIEALPAISYFVGNGQNFIGNVPAERHKVTRVVPNTSYRVFVATPNVDMTGVSSGGIFVIRCEKSDSTYTEPVAVTYGNTIAKYYDIVTPDDTVAIYIGGRCAVGVKMLCIVLPVSGVSTSDIDAAKKEMVERISPMKNFFDFHPFYHHLNQEQAIYNIPGQSLFDIGFAKSLGFDMIEASIHKCSDGVFVCKHGVGGVLGQGIKAVDEQDYSGTLFSAVTSTWLRENITYVTRLQKYSTFIPTLDEFARECKKLSMRIKIAYDADALDILRQYLTDDMIWMTLSQANRPSGFRGCIEKVCNSPSDIDSTISASLVIGAPLNIVIGAGTLGNYTDAQLANLVNKAHINGFTVSIVYPSTDDIIRCKRFGVDAYCSTFGHTNMLQIGNEVNITTLNDVLLVKSSGALYEPDEDVVNMAENSTLHISANALNFGVVSLRIRYNGTISIVIGESNASYRNYTSKTSDGSEEVELSLDIEPTSLGSHDRWFTITANAQTTIYTLNAFCSRIQ